MGRKLRQADGQMAKVRICVGVSSTDGGLVCVGEAVNPLLGQEGSILDIKIPDHYP